MANVIKKVKIKKEDGTFTDYISIGADARNIDMTNGYNVQETIGTINVNEDGSIAEQLNNIDLEIRKKAFYYNSVADMKNANLQEGEYVLTLGYYEANDGGDGEYKIVSGNYTDDGGRYHKLDNGLFAELIIDNYITPEQFGAYGDEIHDDSSAIQKAFNTGKVIEFSPKVYLCFKLVANNPLIIHGNGATLKRPNLSIAPYNYTVAQMKGVKTLTAGVDINISNLHFDNNCFTMWKKEDGYAQEQSASLFLNNSSTKFTVFIDQCTFKDSAGDGILIFNNCKAFITNCESTETFRGGLTIVGTSEVNVDGWISNAITLRDGFDIEMASGTAAGELIVNMNNIVVDYDLDIAIPSNGRCNISNLFMRDFSEEWSNAGFAFTVDGILNVTNSILRSGNRNYSICFGSNSNISLDHCNIIGPSTGTVFDMITRKDAVDCAFSINNCTIDCYDCMHMSVIDGNIDFNNCNIECEHCFLYTRGNASPQPKYFNISNCYIKNGGTTLLYINQTSYVTFEEGVNLYLSNLKLEGSGSIRFGGNPTIHYSGLQMEAAYTNNFDNAAAPIFLGTGRVIIVPSAEELTFRGWVPNDDIAITLDTKKRYKYISGTTWNEITN